MDLGTAVTILDIHNQWRRDETGKMPMVEPNVLGQAIDIVVKWHKEQKEQQVNGFELLGALLRAQREIISDPRRFNGVSIEDIKLIFVERGISYDDPF